MSDAPSSPTRAARLFVYLKLHWRAFTVGAVFLVFTNLLALRIPREIGKAVQRLKDASDGLSNDLLSTLIAPVRLDTADVPVDILVSLVVGHAQLIILFALGAAVTRVISRTQIFNAGRLIEYRLRNDIFEHLTKLSPNWYNHTATGDLTSRVINDTTYVRLLFGMGVLHSINTVIAVTTSLSLMVGVDWRLAIFCTLPFPFILYFVQRLAKAMHAHTRTVQEQLGRLSSQVQEDLSGIAVIKTYGVEDSEEAKFRAECEAYVVDNLKLARVRSVLMPLMMSLGGVATLLVLYLGGLAVLRKDIQLGEFIEFSGYVGYLAWPVMALGWVLSVWHRGTAAFDRLMEVLDVEPDIVAPSPDETAVRVESGRIEFRNVSFGYDADEPVLRDITMTIENGRRVGIIGRSGSGKTTLVNLIGRLYDAQDGEILIDGHPIRDIPTSSLRQAIGYAPQEPFLFSTTVEKNILMGLEARNGKLVLAKDANNGGQFSLTEATQNELQGVVEASQLDGDLVALPKGLQTMVGERGITLSGGQKQRVALARAMLTEPTILILDDSLSSVDTRTERAILDHLEHLMEGRTAIVVTHRFSVLELMDEVIVLQNGRIAERGTHSELLSTDGTYAAMVKRQALREEISAL